MPRATKNLLGEKFGRLTVVGRNYDKQRDYKDKKGRSRAFWDCLCDCGNYVTVAAFSLLNGRTQSCGCLQKDKTKCEFVNLSGKRFGRLTVINLIDSNAQDSRRDRKWLCKCDCGNTVVYSEKQLLKSKNVHSCGCYTVEHAKNIGHSNKKYNTYDLSGDYGIGYTPSGEPFYFDIEDYDKIKQYCWSINEYGYVKTSVYIDNNTSRTIRMHRLIMDVLDNDDVVVDHIGHNCRDNRKSQLRICTQDDNTYNTITRSTNTSGFKGVSWDIEKQKWLVQIWANNKKIHIGRYNNINDAIKARKDAEEKYHKEYSYDNSMIYASSYIIKETAESPDIEESEELIDP